METSTLDAGKQAELIGKPAVAIIAVIIYGIYRAAQEGIWPVGWPNGTILVVGGILSALSIMAYVRTLEGSQTPSVGKAVAAFSGLIPYLYSLYVIAYVGVWSLIQLFMSGFSWTGLLVGLFGIVFGYRIMKTFYDITELGNSKV